VGNHETQVTTNFYPDGLHLKLRPVCHRPTTRRVRTATSNQQPATNSFFEALTHGQIKAFFRYSGQRRNSNLHVLQDDSAPDISEEKLQYYSAIGGFFGYETASWFKTTAGATVYGAIPFGTNPDNRRGLGGLTVHQLVIGRELTGINAF